MALETVIPHNHDLTSVLCIYDTQTLKNNKTILDFSSTSNTGGIDFTASSSLLADLCQIEQQILTEIAARQNLANIDLSQDYGLVKLAEDSGLTYVNGYLKADFSSLQPKLVSGTNIKTITTSKDTISLLGSGTITLSVADDISAAISELKNNSEDDKSNSALYTAINTLDSELTTLQKQFTDEFTDFQNTVSGIQTNVINILYELQSGELLNNTVSYSTNAASGCVVCNSATPNFGTCDDIVLQSAKNYYRKTVTSDISSCGGPPWFHIVPDNISTTDQEYMVVKFTLDIETTADNLVPNNDGFPWGTNWIGTDKPVWTSPTNAIFEVIGYWKCETWDWYAKFIHQYTEVCAE